MGGLLAEILANSEIYASLPPIGSGNLSFNDLLRTFKKDESLKFRFSYSFLLVFNRKRKSPLCAFFVLKKSLAFGSFQSYILKSEDQRILAGRCLCFQLIASLCLWCFYFWTGRDDRIYLVFHYFDGI